MLHCFQGLCSHRLWGFVVLSLVIIHVMQGRGSVKACVMEEKKGRCQELSYGRD